MPFSINPKSQLYKKPVYINNKNTAQFLRRVFIVLNYRKTTLYIPSHNINKIFEFVGSNNKIFMFT